MLCLQNMVEVQVCNLVAVAMKLVNTVSLMMDDRDMWLYRAASISVALNFETGSSDIRYGEMSMLVQVQPALRFGTVWELLMILYQSDLLLE